MTIELQKEDQQTKANNDELVMMKQKLDGLNGMVTGKIILCFMIVY